MISEVLDCTCTVVSGKSSVVFAPIGASDVKQHMSHMWSRRYEYNLLLILLVLTSGEFVVDWNKINKELFYLGNPVADVFRHITDQI